MLFYHGIGHHNMWGLSPCLDLLLYCRTCNHHFTPIPSNPIRILLLHPCDPRHLIKTIVRYSRKENNHRPIHFYLMEPISEILARHLLLLQIFFDCDKTPIRKRAKEFLEIFGNTLLSKHSADYITRCSFILREFDYDEPKTGNSDFRSTVDYSYLRQRDRDELTNIFHSWASPESYDVASFREERMRFYYGNRYDCLENIIDWDYHMKVKNVASIIHRHEFRTWRMTGVGFQFGDRSYTVPNKTNATFLKGTFAKADERRPIKHIQGYSLDILIGPYIGFGVEVDMGDKDSNLLHQVINKGTGAEQHRHNASEVSLYNIISMMWELENREPYAMSIEHDIFSGLELDKSIVGSESNKRRVISDFKLILMKGSSIDEIMKKKQHENFFDHVYFSQQIAHQIESAYLPKLLTKNGTFAVETPMHVFELSRAEKEKWFSMLQEISVTQGFRQVFAESGREVQHQNNHYTDSGTMCFAF